MHYKDGTEACIGDIVKGQGYNIPYEITGPVNQLLPQNGEGCNIRVLIMRAKWNPFVSDGDGGKDADEHFSFEQYEEAGAVKAFELIHRENWHKVPSQKLEWKPVASK